MTFAVEPADRIIVIDGVKAPIGWYLQSASSAGAFHRGEACIDWTRSE
jgi:hypothetical protein